MSAGAGAIQGTKSGTSWAGATVAAIMLAVLIAVTVFAMTRNSGTAGTKQPASTFQKTEQTSGGQSVPNATSEKAPSWKPVKVGSFVCNQCR